MKAFNAFKLKMKPLKLYQCFGSEIIYTYSLPIFNHFHSRES